MNGFYGQSIVKETKNINESYITEGNILRKFVDRMINGSPTVTTTYDKDSDIPESKVPKEYKKVMKEFMEKLSKRLEKEEDSKEYKKLIEILKSSNILNDPSVKKSSFKPGPWKFHRLSMLHGAWHEKRHKENEYSYQASIIPMNTYDTLFMLEISNKTDYKYSFYDGFMKSVDDTVTEFKSNSLIEHVHVSIQERYNGAGHLPIVFLSSKPFIVDK